MTPHPAPRTPHPAVRTPHPDTAFSEQPIQRTSDEDKAGRAKHKTSKCFSKMFASGGPRCPVELFKQYLSRRPQELRDKGPF